MFITVSLITAGIIMMVIIAGWIVNTIAEFVSDVFDVFVTGLKATLIFGVATTVAICVYHFI